MRLSLLMLMILGVLLALDRATPAQDGFGTLAFVWFVLTAWTLSWYWFVRLVRAAWRAGSRRHE